jgi:predicted Zn-dependent protease
VLATALICSATLAAQTVVKAPKNKYTPEQDVQIGREAAAEVRREYPVITEERIAGYLDRLGRQLVAQSPPELNQPVFEYSFTAVNLKEINAFALPGGPMFVNRGMFDAATSEGEVVGVMAHELAHVLLRHGTKAQGFQLGALAGAIAGAVIGGGVGQVISQGSQFGLGTWLMKYSRDYEKQADLLGAQIMARAGYDPRDLGTMFETISKQSKGSGAPEWLSSHPNPGNRSQYIAQEAATLSVASNPSAGRDFPQVRSQFAGLPPAQSMAEIARRDGAGGGGGGGGTTTVSAGTPGQPVPRPATQYRTARGGQVFQVAVPSNWQAISGNSSIKYVPQNGYGPYRGQQVFTHGVELGVARSSAGDLHSATTQFVQALARGNPALRQSGNVREVQLSGRPALAVPLVNESALGENERVGVYTVQLADGNLFYFLTIVPERDASLYGPTFERVAQSIRLNTR